MRTDHHNTKTKYKLVQDIGPICFKCDNVHNPRNLEVHHIIPQAILSICVGDSVNIIKDSSENTKLACNQCHEHIHQVVNRRNPVWKVIATSVNYCQNPEDAMALINKYREFELLI
jgi:hypothetical protein